MVKQVHVENFFVGLPSNSRSGRITNVRRDENTLLGCVCIIILSNRFEDLACFLVMFIAATIKDG